MAITGTLKSVDQFLNFRIENLTVVGNEAVERGLVQGGGAEGEVDAAQARWPHLVSRGGRHKDAVQYADCPPDTCNTPSSSSLPARAQVGIHQRIRSAVCTRTCWSSGYTASRGRY